MSDRRNFVSFVCGKRGSGKTHLLGRMAQEFPRRLILDFLGEHEGEIPGALEAWSYVETLAALQAVRGRPRWTVVSSVDERHVPALLDALAPRRHGGAVGYSRAVGGMVLQMSECDSVLPNGGASEEARSIFKRGRHHSLSILAATQRPAETNRIVTAMADVICAFRQHEPRDIAYLSSVMGGSAVAPLLTQLPPRTYLRYKADTGQLAVVGPQGDARPVRMAS